MSLNTLIQQILLSEQQIHEQTGEIKEVEVAIIRCKEKIKNATGLCAKNSAELHRKTLHLSALTLQRDGMKKSHDQMLSEIEKLLKQKSHLCEHLAQMKKQSKEEEAKFLQEISRFNSQFSLLGDNQADFQNQTQTTIPELDREEEPLPAEMEQMVCQSSHTSSLLQDRTALLQDRTALLQDRTALLQDRTALLQDRTALLQERQRLANTLEDLDQRLKAAKAMTESLGAERLLSRQRALTDSTCLRLRKELDVYREGELELLREALRSEIHFLKSKLDGRQNNPH